jgi:hypothetical protein
VDRILTGVAIALAALLLSGGLVREAAAGEAGGKSSAATLTATSQAPVVNGLRSERVLSLVLTLEALRAVPALVPEARKSSPFGL